jgi:hypothetical protein
MLRIRSAAILWDFAATWPITPVYYPQQSAKMKANLDLIG